MKKYTNTGNKDTRSGFGAGLTELGQKNENVVALCADLIGSLKMDDFKNINKNIVVNGQTMPLNAVSGKEVNITSNQRLSFSHNMEDKLKPGFYRVAVYADLGMLGSANFRLD